MSLVGVRVEVPTNQPIVLLREEDGQRYLPIFIGPPEATAIVYALQGMETPRPMTHDLFTDIISELQGEIVRVAVTELRDNTFYARITIAKDGREVEIDSRPSDAIALAVRCDAQIFAAEEVIEESGIEFQSDDDEQPGLVTASSLADLDPAEFRQFLETVTPEQFATSLRELQEQEDDDEYEEDDEPE